MAAAGFAHSQIAAMLVDGCLAHIAGNVQGKMPIKPVPVTDLERAQVGLKQGGQTLFYPLNDGGVYVDLTGSMATVWFVDGDYDRALAAFETAVKKTYRVKQLKDEAVEVPKHHRRSYEIDFGNSRLAQVVVDYAERGATPARFRVRIGAMVRK